MAKFDSSLTLDTSLMAGFAGLVEGYPELSAYALGEVQEVQDDEKVLKEQRSLFALETQLQRTKLCRYHLKGLCKHGSGCRFAHGPQELQQPPNLQKTRMCPDLLSNGECHNPQCTFAHQESELKKVNICHKTAVCTWFLAGKCRNGTECHFAHGEHELRGNGRNLSQEQKFEPPAMRDNVDGQQKEPMFIQSSMAAPEPLPRQAPVVHQVPPYMSPENSQFQVPCVFQATQQPLASVPPLPPPPGFMPSYVNGMQPCVGGYPTPPQQEVPPMQATYMSMPPPPLMPPFTDVEATRSLPLGLPVTPVVAATPAPGLVPPRVAQQGTDKTWQLTELAVQINMLSEEVKRLQDWIIPPSMQSTKSGSSTRSSSGNRTPRAENGEADGPVTVEDMDPRSFEEKVAGLQNELKRVIVEGQRCGKIRQSL
jgi:hypothetical protein